MEDCPTFPDRFTLLLHIVLAVDNLPNRRIWGKALPVCLSVRNSHHLCNSVCELSAMRIRDREWFQWGAAVHCEFQITDVNRGQH